MFKCVARKGLVGYYKREGEEKLYKFDFSSEPVNPIPVDSIPDDAEFSDVYEPVSLSDDELEKFERELKEYISINFNKRLAEEKVESVYAFTNIEREVCRDIYKLIDEKFSAVLVPSYISYNTNIHGQSGISAVVKFTEPIPTAWEGIEENEDRVIIKPVDRVYAGNGEVVDIIDYSNLSVPRFYITDLDTTKKIENILGRYLYIDANDIEGHLLGSLYFVGVRLENVSKDLQDMLDRIRREERERERLAFKKEKEEFLTANKDKLEFVLKYTERFDEYVPDSFKRILEDIDSIQSYEFESLKRKLDDIYRDVKRKFEYYSNPDTVVFKKGDFVLTVGDVLENKGFVEIPKEYIGQFIGKGGQNVKSLSKKIGVKIKVVEKDIGKGELLHLL